MLTGLSLAWEVHWRLLVARHWWHDFAHPMACRGLAETRLPTDHESLALGAPHELQMSGYHADSNVIGFSDGHFDFPFSDVEM